MKTLFLLIYFFVALPCFMLGQTYYWVINFDDGQNLNLLNIDHSLPSNIWQIGNPQKIFFNTSFSSPNAMVTDAISPYPNNNLSRFYLYVPAPEESLGQELYFKYKIFTDTLSDNGMIEFSFDKGLTWNNFIAQAIAHLLNWDVKLAYYPYTTLYTTNDSLNPFTGKSSGWYNFHMSFPAPTLPWITDTVYFRFTFQSNEIQTNKDGWMLDDIIFGNLFEGLEENDIENLVEISPNPFYDSFTINLANNATRHTNQHFTYEIYSLQGKIIETNTFDGKTIQITDLNNYSSGIYMLKILTASKTLCVKKIIKN